MKKMIIFLISSISINLFASEAIGFYSRGKLKNAVFVDDYSNSHFVKLYRGRGQNFGTKEIFFAVTGLSSFMQSQYPSVEKIQVGDLAAMRGGKINRHKSHQNGLDADIVYFRVNEFQQSESYPEWYEDFVKSGKLTKNFDIERNWEAFKYLVHNNNVGRIFVDGVIKNSLCEYAKKVGEYEQEIEVLRVIRPENSVHKNHFHLRLKCPSSNRRCKKQREPNKGSGC